MPDVLTHVLFGEDCINKIHNRKLKDRLHIHKNIFDLGTQGPDPFFYYRIWPWTNSKGIPQIGSDIHSKKTKLFFSESLRYLKSQESHENQYDILLPYLFGFICHYVLDKNAHPFIHYFAGFYDPDQPTSKKYKNYHKKLEILIDLYMLQYKKNLSPMMFPPYKIIETTEEELSIIGQYYTEILRTVHGKIISPIHVKQAVRDMKKALRFLHDSTGFKTKLIERFESMIQSNGLYSSALYPRETMNLDKHLNLVHQEWCHPCNQEERFTTSFIDIYESSVKEAVPLLEQVYNKLLSRSHEISFQNFFDDLSFSTGKPWNVERKLQYSKCTFE